MPKIYPALSRAIEGFLLWKSASGRSENTLNDYGVYLRLFAKWANDPDINKVTSKTIEGFYNYLQTDYRTVRGKVQTQNKLSSKTVSNVWIGHNVFWKWAVAEYEIPNPFNLPKIKAYSQPVHPFNQEEIEKLLKGIDTTVEKVTNNRSPFTPKRPTRKRDRAIVLTLLDTGVRVSGLCGINVGDIEFEAGRIKVTEKGDKTRYVYFGKRAKQALFAYYSERFPRGKPRNDEPLFVNQDDINRMTRGGVQQMLDNLGLKVGVPNTHPHRFRHTFAIEFLRNGGNVFTLKQLLGHSTLDMVSHYVELAQIDFEREHEKASPADRWHLK